MKTRFSNILTPLLLAAICASAQYNAYLGNLHSHTSNSDGSGTPEQAFAYARDVAQIDFLAVTDHLEQIYYLPWKWSDTKSQADAATTDGVFIGIAGYEWSCPYTNHVNVFNTPNMVTPLSYFDWPRFYNDVLDERPAFAQFNHPGREELAHDWNNFAYVGPAVDSAFALIEVREFYQDSFYQMALDSGWHVSPVSNQDNHSADWGTKNDHRAGIWATELTREALFEAIVAGRTFSTHDKNAQIWIQIDHTPMGSRVERAPYMRLTINLFDPDEEGWSIVDVRASGGRSLFTLPPREENVDTMIVLSLTDEKWVFVRACQPDGQWIWSAPVYIEGTPLAVEEQRALPQGVSISVFPNPFNSSVRFSIDGIGTHGLAPLQVEIYDLAGRQVAEIPVGESLRAFPLDGNSENGSAQGHSPTTRQFIWQPDESLPSGVYLVRVLSGGAFTPSTRVIYLK